MAVLRMTSSILIAAVFFCLATAVRGHGNLDQSTQIARKFVISQTTAKLTAAGITTDQLPFNGYKCGKFAIAVKKSGETTNFWSVSKTNDPYTAVYTVAVAPNTLYTWELACSLIADDGHVFVISGKGSFRTLK